MKEKLMYTSNVYTIFVVLEKAFDIFATVQTKQESILELIQKQINYIRIL